MTVWEQKYWVGHYALIMPAKQIARKIGRSGCFVRAEIKRQGIVIPAETIARFKKDSQFKKGQVPPNKGKKRKDWMSDDQIEKMKKTQFQKGNVPHNTRSDYDVSLRRSNSGKYPYLFIRIRKSKWVLYHRWLWEQVYGPIPEGHNVQFKDGNYMNCELSNLYLIDRQQQAVINKNGGRKLSPELKETILLINDIKKSINEKQDNGPQ